MPSPIWGMFAPARRPSVADKSPWSSLPGRCPRAQLTQVHRDPHGDRLGLAAADDTRDRCTGPAGGSAGAGGRRRRDAARAQRRGLLRGPGRHHDGARRHLHLGAQRQQPDRDDARTGCWRSTRTPARSAPRSCPNPNGTVRVVLPAGDGETVYVGGSFTSIGGVARDSLARVRISDGAVVNDVQRREHHRHGARPAAERRPALARRSVHARRRPGPGRHHDREPDDRRLPRPTWPSRSRASTTAASRSR